VPAISGPSGRREADRARDALLTKLVAAVIGLTAAVTALAAAVLGLRR
jgi:hypothetical protein